MRIMVNTSCQIYPQYFPREPPAVASVLSPPPCPPPPTRARGLAQRALASVDASVPAELHPSIQAVLPAPCPWTRWGGGA